MRFCFEKRETRAVEWGKGFFFKVELILTWALRV